MACRAPPVIRSWEDETGDATPCSFRPSLSPSSGRGGPFEFVRRPMSGRGAGSGRLRPRRLDGLGQITVASVDGTGCSFGGGRPPRTWMSQVVLVRGHRPSNGPIGTTAQAGDPMVGPRGRRKPWRTTRLRVSGSAMASARSNRRRTHRNLSGPSTAGGRSRGQEGAESDGSSTLASSPVVGPAEGLAASSSAFWDQMPICGCVGPRGTGLMVKVPRGTSSVGGPGASVRHGLPLAHHARPCAPDLHRWRLRRRGAASLPER